MEAITGTKKNTFAEAAYEKALEMCREVFLTGPQRPEERRAADGYSYMGGSSSPTAVRCVCHALSYGLGKVLHIHHCIANRISV
ncbi:MAG: iron-containing alcohol dehydrogenase [Flavobacteriales bacterium]|nr:iron-containing alcohol dehydrogenase [Flavobacteriales bacterium]